ncbi:hypothetical protein [uncultured Tenacibaculum sp.]|uniref:hypothetical protein n=1 Tax=uncultured Tenacibaculum sp. TaxID=174713 RepID=UPI00262A7D9D|nr:hypothetical protein [uncultured Tenacibaculum sp.]
MKKIALLLIITSFFACHEKFEPHKFNGFWFHNDNTDNRFNLPSVIFKNDSAYFFDVYQYAKKSKYKIHNNQISFFFKNDTLVQKVTFESKNLILYLDNHKYNLWKNNSIFNDIIDHDLIGVKTKSKIQSNYIKRFESGFHIFKDTTDSLTFKLDNTYTHNKEKLIEFILHNTNAHFDIPSFVIYIGKDITLKDLITSCYQELFLTNLRQVLLITDFDFEKNTYSGIIERFDFWDFQIQNYISINKLSPYPRQPLLKENNKDYYLEKYYPKQITINTKEDFHLLNTSLDKQNLLISINPNLDLKDYFELKQLIQAIKKDRKIKVRTEFILSS